MTFSWNWDSGMEQLVSYDRHDVQLFLKHTGFSKTGTYRWDTLARLMADEVNFIASGYSARFLYCSILDAPSRYLNLLSPSGNDTLAQLLGWLLGELRSCPKPIICSLMKPCYSKGGTPWSMLRLRNHILGCR